MFLIKKHKKIQIILIITILSLFLSTITLKTSAETGAQQSWPAKIFDNTKTDEACAVTTDSNNNVIVTGYSEINGSSSPLILGQ